MESHGQKITTKGEGSKGPSLKSLEEIAKNIEDKVRKKLHISNPLHKCIYTAHHLLRLHYIASNPH